MNIVWSVIEENKEVRVLLVYNMYLGTKKVFIDNVEMLKLKRFHKNNKISFENNNKEYTIELGREDFGYSGFLVTDQGDKISSEVNTKIKKKTSLWIIPFVIINMSIPIISIEAVTPWLIGTLTSYITAKVSQSEHLSFKKKVGIYIIISIFAWIAYYLFYLIIKKQAASKGFLPFN